MLLVGFAAMVAAVPYAMYGYDDWQLDRDLAAAIAETDELDPGWRFEELQAKRGPLADDENGALAILRIGANFEKDKQYHPKFRDLPVPAGMRANSDEHVDFFLDIYHSFDNLPEAPQLNEQQIKGLESEWKEWKSTVGEARKLRRFSRGLSPANATWESFGFQYYLSASNIVQLLALDINRSCQAEQFEDALDSCEALLAIARINPDDSIITWATSACERTHRLLGQGEVDPARLAVLQRFLQEDDQFDRFRALIRGDRAYSWVVFCAWREGTLDKTQRISFENRQKSGPEPEPSWYAKWLPAKKPEDPRKWQARYFRNVNQWTAFASKPEAERASGLPKMIERFDEDCRSIGYLTAESLVAQMQVRTTYTAIAVERFRLDTRSWPNSLTDLVPKYLAAVPEDFYSGNPLQYRRVDHGYVVYSVGPDGKDDGGLLRGQRNVPIQNQKLDIGVRLWDPAHRRQSPLPPVKQRPKSKP